MMHGRAISDNEIYLLIKYTKSVLWRVEKCLSYIEDARCLKIKWVFFFGGGGPDNGQCRPKQLEYNSYSNITVTFVDCLPTYQPQYAAVFE